MRQVFVRVPAGKGDAVLASASKHDGVFLVRQQGTAEDGSPVETVVAYLPNAELGPFIDSLEVPGVQFSILPVGALTILPPATRRSEQVEDVSHRSPLEIYLDGIQAIGSWTGYLGYAVSAGVVVWLGLFTETVFLLIGAMLIAPFAGPAMNTAIASARGDFSLLWRSAARFVGGLATTAATASLLSLLFRQEAATDLMLSVANVSNTAFLLPLAAGAAGALHLSQSQRSSLVSGAGAGLLIAASLAPPVGVIGMGAVLGEWGLVGSALFLLGLQLVGINLAGAATFRLFGLRASGPRYAHGRAGVVATALTLTACAMLALLVLQFSTPSSQLQRAGLASRAREAAIKVVDEDSGAWLLDAEAFVPRTDSPDRSAVVVTVRVQRDPAREALSDSALDQRLTRRIRSVLRERMGSVVPLVDVTVLEPGLPSGAR